MFSQPSYLLFFTDCLDFIIHPLQQLLEEEPSSLARVHTLAKVEHTLVEVVVHTLAEVAGSTFLFYFILYYIFIKFKII